MVSHSFEQVVRQASIKTLVVNFALKNVNVEEFRHGIGLPSRSSPRTRCKVNVSAFAKATARQSPLSPTARAKTGGKGIRTPGLLIANETLYQLSYTPAVPCENYHDAKTYQQAKRH